MVPTHINLTKGPPMHDPEKFQAETIKAIADLHDTLGQTLSRQLALGAMVRSLLGQLPLAALAQVQEEYEAEVDHQAAQIPPDLQRPLSLIHI